MSRSPAPEVVRRALLRHSFVGASDATLLVRYVRHNDHAAFAELVDRYAPLVWGACLRVCSDSHAAEEAFQATFIALARRAGSIRRAECLPGWLHGVARRCAWRIQAARRVTEAVPECPSPAPSPVEQASASELLAAVEQEVARLPEKYRSAVLLCWFEDGSLDEAANRLGVSRGVLWGRLKRGRERLRRRLAARGYGPPAVLAAAVITGSRAAAGLVHRATEAALRAPADVPAGILGAWIWLKAAGALAVAAAIVVGAVTVFPQGAPEPPNDPPKKEPVAASETAVPIDDGFPLPPGAIHRFGNRQLRHPTGIMAAAVSPNGKLLATAGYGGVVVWDLKTLAAKRSFPRLPVSFGNTTARSSPIAFLPDSASLLVSVQPGTDGPIRVDQPMELAQVWDVETGKKKFGVSGPVDWYASTWPTAQGKEIVVYSNTGDEATFRFFDARDGKALRTVASPSVGNSPWFAPGCNVIVAQERDGTAGRALDVSTGKELFALPEAATQVAISRDGKVLAWVGKAGRVHVHDLEAKKEKFSFPHPEKDRPGPMAISADNKTLYFSSNHGRLFRWDLENNKRGREFLGRHNSWSLTGVVLSPDGAVLYSVSQDHLVKRWDLKTGEELPLPDGYTTHTSMVVARDGKHLIVTDHQGQIDYWDLATGRRVKQLQKTGQGGINDLAESADGRWLAAGRTSQDIRLFDLTTGKVVRDIYLGDKAETRWGDAIQRVAFDPLGKVVYCTSQKTGLTAWEVPGGKRIWNTSSPGSLLAVDPRGRWLAAGGEYRPARTQWTLLDAKSGEVAARADVESIEVGVGNNRYHYAPYVSGLDWLPDGSRIVSTHYDGTVRLWDPETRKEVRRLNGGHVGSPGRPALSADSKWIVVGWGDGSLSVWEVATGSRLTALPGHDSGVLDVAFTRDGRGLVSNADLAPVLWDLCPKDLPRDGLWDLLASEDAGKAYPAQWALIKDPAAAVKLFAEQVKPAEVTVKREQFDKWVAALDSPQFRTREAADKELTSAGAKVPIGWLRKVVADSKADEPRARLSRLLARRESEPDTINWRLSRAVQVLELAGTDAAKGLLKEWAATAEGPLADAAKEALGRIAKR